MPCRESSRCQGPGAGADLAGLVRAEQQEVKLKRGRPRAWGHVGVRVRMCEVGAFEGSEHTATRSDSHLGGIPLIAVSWMDYKGPGQKQDTSWEVMVA